MKRQARIVLAVLLMMFVVFVGQSSAQDNMGRWIVTIQGPAGRAEQAVIRVGGAVDHVYDIIPAIAIRIPAAALPGLKRNPNVVSIEPDTVFSALEQELPWGIDRIDAELVHSDNTGEGVNVAVLDTGIDYKHPDLATNCAGGINIIKPRKDYRDDNGHGTHCAGIIAAEDNEIGVVGVAPDASLYGVKVLDRRGRGWLSDIIAGLEWCANNNIDIVNMSLGGGAHPDLEAACDAADGAGLILVAAAGNDYGDPVIYPAAYGSVIAVSATNSSDGLAGFSNYGDEIELAAPGVSIYSTVPGGLYSTKSGTSMACPHVAGVAALVISAGSAGIEGVRAQLQNTAEDLGTTGPDDLYGHGLVDAEAAAGVSGELQPPVANAGPDQTVSDVDENAFETVTLDGSASYDPDGTIDSYEWKEGTTILATAASITIDFAVGVHTVTLTVTDNDVLTDTDEVIITVTEVPVLTTIEVLPSSVILYVGETQEFTATGKDQYGDPIETGPITWASSNTAVGTIDSSGLFTAAGAGTTTVSATSGNVVGTGTVTVEAAPAMEVAITKNAVKTRWDKRNLIGKVEAQIAFTVDSGSSDQVLLKEITDELGIWSLEKPEVEVKINGVRYKWLLDLDENGDAIVDFGAHGKTLSSGDNVQVKMKLLNNQPGDHSLTCQILANSVGVATNTVGFSL